MRWSDIANRWSDTVNWMRGGPRYPRARRWAWLIGGIAVFGTGLWLIIGGGILHHMTVWLWVGILLALVGLWEFYLGLRTHRRETD